MALFDYDFPEWKRISRGAGFGRIVVYLLFVLYAPAEHSGFLFLYYVNLIIHEGATFFQLVRPLRHDSRRHAW